MNFEYKVVDFPWNDLQEGLNPLGAEGWMLVHTEDHGPGRVLCILMRQVWVRPTNPEEYFGEDNPEGTVRYA